jgi:hypothetical protein
MSAKEAAEAQHQAAAKKKKEHKRMEQPAREYNDLIQLVDHAVDYDWTSAALLLGKDARADVILNTEQTRLLYGSSLSPPRQGIEIAQSAASSLELPATMQGWSKCNVLSARGAWDWV